MNVVIRQGASADAENLAALAARTFLDTFAEGSAAEDMALHLARAYGTAQQGAELADPRIVTLVAESSGQLVGFAQLRDEPAPPCVEGDAPIELWRFYLDREWHGKGLAQMLMERVDEEARRRHARTVWLGVWEHNERAKAFYRKCAFVDVGAHVFMVGHDGQTDRIMVRPVTSGER